MFPLKDYPFAARPMIVAHRGDTSLGAKENSIEAVASALVSGADMIEVDVQWSADEEFVCYHDEKHPALGAIHKADYRKLKEHGIASLTEILTIGKGKSYFNIEIKEYSARDPKEFMRGLIHRITELGMDEYVLFSSFRADFLCEAGWMIPTCIIHPSEAMKNYFALHSYAAPAIFNKPLDIYLPSELMAISLATGYACQISELTPESLADITRHNIFLGVYTITTELEFDQAVARGARILVCEAPHRFAALRNHRFPAIETTPIR